MKRIFQLSILTVVCFSLVAWSNPRVVLGESAGSGNAPTGASSSQVQAERLQTTCTKIGDKIADAQSAYQIANRERVALQVENDSVIKSKQTSFDSALASVSTGVDQSLEKNFAKLDGLSLTDSQKVAVGKFKETVTAAVSAHRAAITQAQLTYRTAVNQIKLDQRSRINTLLAKRLEEVAALKAEIDSLCANSATTANSVRSLYIVKIKAISEQLKEVSQTNLRTTTQTTVLATARANSIQTAHTAYKAALESARATLLTALGRSVN